MQVIAVSQPKRIRAETNRRFKTAPSLQLQIDRLCTAQVGCSIKPGPLCRLGKMRSDIVSEVTQKSVEAIVQSANAEPDVFEGPSICISTKTHDDKQLIWEREGVPVCASGEACAAYQVVAAEKLGPLKAYLYPEEQAALEQGMPPKRTGPMFCLLCFRRATQAATLGAQAISTNVAKSQKPRAILLPPFQNPVDCKYRLGRPMPPGPRVRPRH